MDRIQIPAKFSGKLEENQELDGIVKTTLHCFSEIIEEKELFFFPEYTNHGIKHINDVLISSENLITDSTFSNILSSKDVGYYTLSVLLHDLGMHITLDGFVCLLNGDYDDFRVKEFDEFTWKHLWNEYLSEAKKFSGRQLEDIFGRSDELVEAPTLDDPLKINLKDRLLIGEFVRRHHARLAHEIALNGFPIKVGRVDFAAQLELRQRDLVGLIARSHGLSLRRSINYIENLFGRTARRFPNAIHATYLMILLRISDYIQIDGSRTSKFSLKSRTFSSPISSYEHKAHLAVESIDLKWQDDPERIYVETAPKDSRMFIKLGKLIKSIQEEMDMAWAVLGELYGKIGDEERPGIKYRRITSNLSDMQFAEQQPYVAEHFSFRANDEITKLLVAPLYGDDPSFGVRELLQNSVDACRERELYEIENGNHNYKPSIKVELINEFGEQYFHIEDNGVGMDSNVIKDYFLSAGASYRNSLSWQKNNLNQEGKSKVRRSGRFGVGILASFLIGQEIEVKTRKSGSSYGYYFSARLNDQQINVIKTEEENIGTSVKIKIEPDSQKKFKLRGRMFWYGWFTLKSPEVVFKAFGDTIVPYKKLNPDINENLPDDWHGITPEGYDKILWTYSEQYVKTSLTCNGIVIPEMRRSAVDLGLIFNPPQLAVFDSNANMPLSLDRNSCSERLSFTEELQEDLYKDLIAYMLVADNFSSVEGDKIMFRGNKLNHPGLNKGNYYSHNDTAYGLSRYLPSDFGAIGMQWSTLGSLINMIYVSKKGFILNYNYFIQKLKRVPSLFIQLANIPLNGVELDLKESFAYLTTDRTNAVQDYLVAIEPRNWNAEGAFQGINARIYMKTERHKYIFNSTKKRASIWLKKQLIYEFDEAGLTCLKIGKPQQNLLSKEYLTKNDSLIHFARESVIQCDHSGDEVLNRLLAKYIGNDVIIPYSVAERRAKYTLAFDELAKYMTKYENRSE